jgi:hypothetical protein
MVSIKIKNYKCFIEPQGFETLKTINVVIGKNNAGKSSLIDVIGATTSQQALKQENNRIPEIIITQKLTEADLSVVFRHGRSGGGLVGDHGAYGRRFIDTDICYVLNSRKVLSAHNDLLKFPNYLDELAKGLRVPLLPGRRFKNILAERDVIPEADQSPYVTPNGNGATNTIQNFINKGKLPSDLVEEKLLESLNDIFRPDSFYERILVQQDEQGVWEINLDDDQRGRIPLSRMGSGVKTVLLVLVHLLLIPHLENTPVSNYVFAFEELENNIHPTLLRRLLSFLQEFAIREKVILFLTTHSSTMIDFFENDPEAQIVHVFSDKAGTKVKTVSGFKENRNVVTDLGVRASDILQSNGLIWVEGPSDRIYFNRWIEIFSDGQLKEGAHYQCVFYGGRILSHYSSTEGSENHKISMLKVNGHSIILIDSDRKNSSEELSSTKQRIIREVEESGGLAWVTAGRAIENYIPPEAVGKYLKISVPKRVKRNEDFAEYINRLQRGMGDRFLRSKVLFAAEIAQLLTKENLSDSTDLVENVQNVIDQIRQWNQLDN